MSEAHAGRSIATEVAELAALTRGREPEDVVDRLEGLAERLRRGGAQTAGDDALLADIRRRYERELRELERPGPW
jgi:hypothetical protein